VTDCNNFGLNVACDEPPSSGRTGEPITFSEIITQNGECTLGGVLLTNLFSPGTEITSYELIPLGELADPATVIQTVVGNVLISRFSDLGRGKSFRINITVVPRSGGRLVNHAMMKYGALSFACEQSVQIDGTGGETCQAGSVTMSSQLDDDGNVSLVLQGVIDCRTFLQSSTDLFSWTTDREVQVTVAGTKILLGKPGAQQKFYRVAP